MNAAGKPRLAPVRDPKAARALALDNIKLAYWAARKLTRPGQDADEILGAAWRGLLRAAELYDPATGYKFSTYARMWMYQVVGRDQLAEINGIAIPWYLQKLVREYNRSAIRLAHSLKRIPKREEILESLRIDEGKSRCLSRALNAISVTGYQFESGEVDQDQLGFTDGDDVDAAEECALKMARVQKWMGELSERDRQVVWLYAAQGVPFPEIGKRFGFSHQRARKIYRDSIGKLRRFAQTEVA